MSGLCPLLIIERVRSMVVVSDVALTEPGAPMPAAMLPCPSPAGSDWSFQNPVGVDCSSPEPRCIWVAVLHGTTGPTALTRPVSPSQSSHQLRVRRGHPSSSEQGLRLVFWVFYYCRPFILVLMRYVCFFINPTKFVDIL